jgi:hypothetical protein
MSEIPVISYLRYLKEVSRKILQRGGYENVLYRKPRRQDPYYFDFDRPSVNRAAYLRGIYTLLQEQAGKGLFLGLGLITGQVEKHGRKRNLAAPLLFCPLELVQEEDNPSQVELEVLWDSITLNYDLVTMFLEQKDEEQGEDASQIPLAFEGRISLEKLKIISDIEHELDQHAEEVVYQAQLKQGPKLRELMKLLRDNIADFAQISLSNDPYDHRLLEAYVSLRRPTFFSQRFLFLAPVADQLSTSVALQKLIRQVEDDGVQE